MTFSKTIGRFASIAAAAGALTLVPVQALADSNLINNGGFDTNLSDWTQQQLSGTPGTCDFSHQTTAIGGVTGGYAQSSAIITSSCALYQDVALPAGTTNTLTLSLGAQMNGTTTNDAVRLQIRNGSNAVLETLYVRTASSSDAVSSRSYNLDAYAGQTIRIYAFAGRDTGNNQIRLDNVVLDSNVATPPAPVPTLSEWAMILLGLTLAGGAAVVIQRRRLTA